MSNKLNRSDITEETYLVWECPDCNNMNDVFDDCDISEAATCENCETEFDINED